MGPESLGRSGVNEATPKNQDSTVDGKLKGLRGLFARVFPGNLTNAPAMSAQALYEWNRDKAEKKARGDSEWL